MEGPKYKPSTKIRSVLLELLDNMKSSHWGKETTQKTNEDKKMVCILLRNELHSHHPCV